jgi:CHASE3 domain sensor protein
MQTTDGLNRKVLLAFGSALLTLVVVGAISYRGLVVSSESDLWVRHTHEVLASLQDLGSAMRSIEASSRGFVLTGKESYFQSSRASVLRAGQEQALVRNLTADNPVQQFRIPVLAQVAAENIQFSERVMSLRRTEGLAAAADAMQDRPRKAQSDEFQAAVRQVEEEFHKRLPGERSPTAGKHFTARKEVWHAIEWKLCR